MASSDKQESCKSQEEYDCIVENDEQNNDRKPGECIIKTTTSSHAQICENVSSSHQDEDGIREKIHFTRRTRSFPPPLPCLAKSHSQFPHGMPLAQLQPFRSNGRFVLQEVKLPFPVMFQPIRRDGRFVLQLIRQDGVYSMHETEQKSPEAAGKMSTTSAASAVVEDKELVGEDQHKLSEVPDAIDVTTSQCPSVEEAGPNETLVPCPDGAISTSIDSDVISMDSALCIEASGSHEVEDVPSSDQGSAQRITIKPSFEGRCFPKERSGVDWNLAKLMLHVTSVSM